MTQTSTAGAPSQADVIEALRATRDRAKKNLKKTRLAFEAASVAEDSNKLKTRKFGPSGG